MSANHLDTLEALVKQIDREIQELRKSRAPAISTRTRRTWAPDQKNQILAELERVKDVPGATNHICKKYGISTAHLFHWRKQFAREAPNGSES